jgi:hypothetical protein
LLYDGVGLVAKRVEHIPNSDPPQVRIISDNPLCKLYEGSGEEINIVAGYAGSRARCDVRARAEEVNIVGGVVGAAKRLRAIQ